MIKTMSKEPIAPSVRGRSRLRLMQCHRLLIFEEVFSLYLEGKASAEAVKLRATKMLEIGLPEFVGIKRRRRK